MSGKTIATIYFYLISAASLVLIVIGVFSTVNFLVNTSQYEKYPLRYPQGNCEESPYKFGPYPMMDGRVDMASPSAEEIEKQKKICLEQEELLRKEHKVDDLKSAITFTFIGIILFAIHFPLARKQSKA